MLTYTTTCRSCKGPLTVIDPETPEHWHPTCPPAPTPVEKMTEDYLAACAMGDQPQLEADLEAKLWDMQKPPPRLHAAARMYASVYGWPVFPLRPFGGPCDADLPGGGKECREAGICFCPKKPATRHGFQDATTDLAQIDRWWGSKNYNIGIPTGIFFDVIDIDPPNGWTSWHAITKTGPDGTGIVLPDVHGRVVTQSMGAHFYVTPTGNGNRAGMYPGIDYRGVGGYVVAPPSWLGDQQHSWFWGIYPSPFILPTHREVVDAWNRANMV